MILHKCVRAKTGHKRNESLTVSVGLSPGLVHTLISMPAITSTFLNKRMNVNTLRLQHGGGVASLGTWCQTTQACGTKPSKGEWKSGREREYERQRGRGKSYGERERVSECVCVCV